MFEQALEHMTKAKTILKENSLPIMLLMAVTITFLWVWKSGIDTKPKRHEALEEGQMPKEKSSPKTEQTDATKATGQPESLRKRWFIIAYSKKRCEVIEEGSACHKLDCDDGKIYCVNNYTELKDDDRPGNRQSQGHRR